jgi:tetratricopeptide (TPR) repeat protein
VSPELVQLTGSDQPLIRWQQPFDEVLSDVFLVQSEIATKVAAALDVALDPSQQRTLSQAPTANLAAYDAFLRGEEEADGLGTIEPAALRRAVAAYERAVAADSAFAPAWSQLSRTLSHLAYWVEQSATTQSRAREAAERAVRLAPDRPGGWVALGDVAAKIDIDAAKALEWYSRARHLGATDPDVLISSAFSEEILGRWDSAEAHLRGAYALDPRSVEAARNLVETLVLLRRPDEALVLCDRALAMAPHNLSLVYDKTTIHLQSGNLPAARAWIDTAKGRIGRDEVAAYLGAYGDLYWALKLEDQRRLLQLRPEAFGSRKSWAEVLAQVSDLNGDTSKARAYADSAIQDTPRDCAADAQCHSLKAVQLAIAGRFKEAISEGEAAVRIGPYHKNAYVAPYLQHQLARVYILTGHASKALEPIAAMLRTPYYVSAAWIRIDPSFRPLRGDPRFERLLAP